MITLLKNEEMNAKSFFKNFKKKKVTESNKRINLDIFFGAWSVFKRAQICWGALMLFSVSLYNSLCFHRSKRKYRENDSCLGHSKNCTVLSKESTDDLNSNKNILKTGTLWSWWKACISSTTMVPTSLCNFSTIQNGSWAAVHSADVNVVHSNESAEGRKGRQFFCQNKKHTSQDHR